MISPAGEMEVNLTRIEVEKGNLVLSGAMGVWETSIYFTPKEIRQLVGKSLKLSMVWYLIKLPFVGHRPQKEEPKEPEQDSWETETPGKQ